MVHLVSNGSVGPSVLGFPHPGWWHRSGLVVGETVVVVGETVVVVVVVAV